MYLMLFLTAKFGKNVKGRRALPDKSIYQKSYESYNGESGKVA